MKVTTQLRQLIQRDNLIIAPGVFDGLSALLVEQAGFSAVYASGGAISRSSGYPDIGLLSFSEVCERLAHMVDVTTIPIIADADNGYGNALNVSRTMRIFERIGIAGLHLEDQHFPKRCGHLQGKTLIPQQEMVQKIKIAKDSLLDPDFVLIARTDAIAVEGFDAAILRAKAYVEAGADVIFVEAPESEEQIKQIAEFIPQPKLINMFYGGKTPLIAKDELSALGYKIVIIPSDLQRAAIRAMQNTLSVIKRNGDSAELAPDIATFLEREAIIGTQQYLDKGQQYTEEG